MRLLVEIPGVGPIMDMDVIQLLNVEAFHGRGFFLKPGTPLRVVAQVHHQTRQWIEQIESFERVPYPADDDDEFVGPEDC